MEALCRNKRHPYEGNRVPQYGRPGTHCLACRTENHRAIRAARAWDDAPVDAERQAALEAWKAGVDDAIARLRRQEGFDGTQRPWHTLGECLLPEPPGKRPMRRTPQALTECDMCGLPKFQKRGCAPCEALRRAGLDGRRVG